MRRLVQKLFRNLPITSNEHPKLYTSRIGPVYTRCYCSCLFCGWKPNSQYTANNGPALWWQMKKSNFFRRRIQKYLTQPYTMVTQKATSTRTTTTFTANMSWLWLLELFSISSYPWSEIKSKIKSTHTCIKTSSDRRVSSTCCRLLRVLRPNTNSLA